MVTGKIKLALTATTAAHSVLSIYMIVTIRNCWPFPFPAFAIELIDLWKGEKKFKDFINYDKVEEYRNFGGIRNEEDYLITETGARRLGKKIPLTPEEVEALR